MGREPTVEEYVEAFSECEKKIQGRLKILKAHYESPGHVSTATLLAKAVGYLGHRPINRHYGELAKIVGYTLGWSLADLREPDGSTHKYQLSFLLTFEDPAFKGDHWKLILRPNVVRAIEELGWFGPESETEEMA